ncbi:GAF and ANTAR domain-containing protein [Mycobacterium sp. MUNTM1]
MTDNRPSSGLIAELADLVNEAQSNPVDVDQALSELLESVAQFVPGVQYAGITLASRSSGISTAAATHRYPVLLDKLQQQHQEGPCLTAAWEQHVIRIDDLASETRWPRYAEDAVAQTPIRSIMSFELSVTSDTLSALNVYAEQPRAFDHESVELGLIVATHTALAWKMLRRDEQFRSALASRDIIGQAKGILMERFNLDSVAAFSLLTRLSQKTNTKIADLAQRLIDVEHPSRPGAD